MLYTNLIGRTFSTKMDKRSTFTCVAVFASSGELYLVGEADNGSLVTFGNERVILNKTPRSEPENLNGVI